ncbi:MAG: class I SAM-dependent methyltransferase [Chloroflexota bacterium]
MGKRTDGGSDKQDRHTEAICDLELSLMNSRVREWLLRYWDFPLFGSMMRRHHIHLHNATALEAGCGSGYSTLMIWERFQPRSLDAFDLDPGQIERARARHIPARFFVADITDTGLSSRLYEAAFLCGVLHHCPQWRTGLAEISRILKNGGLLFLEEPTHPFVRFEKCLIGTSPANEAWRGLKEVRAEIPRVGLAIVEERPLYFGLFRSLLCVKMAGTEERENAISSLLLLNQEEELARQQGVPA